LPANRRTQLRKSYRYENAPYGLIVRLRLIPDVRRAKGVEFRAKVWAAEFDDPNDYPRFICDFYGFADVKPPDRFRGAKTRRVISIAQIRPGSDGYKRTGSFFNLSVLVISRYSV